MPLPGATALFRTISHPKKRAVLLAYVECGRVKPACAAAQTPFSMHYYWLKHDHGYAEAWEEASTLLAVTLEDEAIRRARDGCRHGIWYQGVRVDDELVYSDTLLIFLLKGAKPEKYKDTVAHQHSGSLTLHETILTQAHQRAEELRHANGHQPALP